MHVVCEVCGDVGYRHLLVQCCSCRNSTRHRYCLDPVIYDVSIEWSCEDCSRKHNEVVESLKGRHGDHHSIPLGSPMINEPNVNRVEVTNIPWPWGRRRRRSHKARRYSTWGCRKPRSHKARRDNTDACTKHFLSGDPFNLSEIFIEESSKCNGVFKERESENDQPENADGSNFAAEIQKPTMNTIECLELSTVKDSCSFSMNNVEGFIPQGAKADFLPSINDVERSHRFVTDDSCPISPIVVQEDGSCHAWENVEQLHPLELVDPNGSSHSPLDRALRIEEQGMKTVLFASVHDDENAFSSEEQIDDSSPMSESWEQPFPLEVVKPCDDVPKSIIGSESPSNYSEKIHGSDPYVGNMDALDHSKECLDSSSMSKNVDLSSSSNGDGNPAVEKDNAETIECLLGMETVTPSLDNVQGSRPSAEPSSLSNGEGESAVEKDSNRTECLSRMEPVTPELDNVLGSSRSIANGCLVSIVENSDEAHRSDNHLLSTKENKEVGQLNVLSYPNISSGKVHCSHNDPNESSNGKPTLKGRDLQNHVQKTFVSTGKKGFCRQLQNDANSEALPSKHDSPCKATKSSFEKQHDGPNSIPRLTKQQKIKLLDRTCSNASLELSPKAKEVNNANDAEPICSNSVPTSENVVSKKRKLPILRRDEDVEPMRLKDTNPPPSENDGQMKMHRRRVESATMKQRRSAEIYKEVQCSGNSANQHVNDHMQAKKRRRINKDKKAPLRNSSVPSAQSDAANLASEALVAEGRCSVSRMPAVSAPTDQQHYICIQPIDRPSWTGIMKIGQVYISLAAHLSNQACKKAQELSRSLPPVMKVTMHSKLKAWPKRWEASEPTPESIGLYFFADDMRPNKDLDRLVQLVTDRKAVLKYVFGSAKLLIFPSVLLEQCQTFQGKHYLWGVFTRTKGTGKVGTPAKQKVCGSRIVGKKRGAAR